MLIITQLAFNEMLKNPSGDTEQCYKIGTWDMCFVTLDVNSPCSRVG